MAQRKFKVGDLVRLKPDTVRGARVDGREDNPDARIQSLLRDIEGGAYLDCDLAWNRYWNVNDLEHADD